MAIFQGLAKGMTNAFMTPFLQRQQQDRQDERVRQQGALLKQGLSQFFGANSPEELALRQMPDEIIKDLANPMVGRYNTRLGNEREDTLIGNKNAREDALLKTKFGREDTQQQQENEGFFQVLDMLDPARAQTIRNNPNVRYSPQAQSVILNRLENQQNVQKINADVKAQYPNAPAFQTVQAAVDWVNNQQGMARDARTLDRQMSMYNTREEGKTKPALSENDLSPYAKTALTLGRQILSKSGLKGLQESLALGEMKALTDYLDEDEDMAIGRILMQEAVTPKMQQQANQPQQSTGFNPQGMQNPPINNVFEFMKKQSPYGVW